MTREPDFDITLKMLPPFLFRAALARLKAGQTVGGVARWLMTQERGPLQHLGLYDIRKQVSQLKSRVDQNEEFFVDKPGQSQPQENFEAQSYDVRLQKLLDTAMAGHATARDVLNFVLCTELQRLRDLRHKGGAHDQIGAVLQHVRRTAEQLCKVGAGSGTDWENFDEIKIEDADSPRMQQLREAFEQMPPEDRMLARQELGLFRSILKLRRKVEQEQAQAGAPPLPKAGPQP